MSAAEMAEKINGACKGRAAAYFTVWGQSPVQPGDWVYQVDGATAHGGRLDITLVDGQGSSAGKNPTTISLFDADQLEIDAKSIRIRKASKVKWRDFEAKPGKGAALQIS